MKNINRIAGQVLVIFGYLLYIPGLIISVFLAYGLIKSARLFSTSSFWETFLPFVILFVIMVFIYTLGRLIICFGKKIKSKAATALLPDLLNLDDFKYCLYLRSFDEDQITSRNSSYNLDYHISLEFNNSEEEQLAKAISDIGRMLAIGIPNERLPSLGATRLYTSDDEWQSTVSNLMMKAQLVVLKLGKTNGFFWEIENTLKNVKPEKVVFLIPHDKNLFEMFRTHLSRFIKHPLPLYIESSCKHLTIGSIIYFTANWKPHIIELKDFNFISNQSKPLISPLRIALKPIYKQNGVKWRRPKISFAQKIIWGFLSLITMFDYIIPLIINIEIMAYICLCVIATILSGFLLLIFSKMKNQMKTLRKYENALIEQMDGINIDNKKG